MSQNTFVKVTLNGPQMKRIQEFFAKVPWIYAKIVQKTAAEAKKRIIIATPRKTGAARRSWRLARAANASYVVVSDRGAGSAYTPFLEYGTGIYGPVGQPITPVKAKWLVFPTIKGNSITGWTKTKSVRGIRPFEMVQGTARNLHPFIRETSHNVIQELLDKVKGAA